MLVGTRRCYSRPDRPGEARREAWQRWSACLAAALAALSVGACSIAFPIPSLLVDPDTTSSLRSPTRSPLSPELDEEDWRRAKSALAVALDPQGSGTTVSWDNPDSARRGNITPVGQPFASDGEVCRAFLATVTGKSAASSLQGTACRPSGGEWLIKDVKPWKKPV
jgi:surface antigen